MAYLVNGVHVLTDEELRERIDGARVESLALAWRWVRDAGSVEEADELVVETLREASADPTLFEAVRAEAERWDEANRRARVGVRTGSKPLRPLQSKTTEEK